MRLSRDLQVVADVPYKLVDIERAAVIVVHLNEQPPQILRISLRSRVSHVIDSVRWVHGIARLLCAVACHPAATAGDTSTDLLPRMERCQLYRAMNTLEDSKADLVLPARRPFASLHAADGKSARRRRADATASRDGAHAISARPRPRATCCMPSAVLCVACRALGGTKERTSSDWSRPPSLSSARKCTRDGAPAV